MSVKNQPHDYLSAIDLFSGCGGLTQGLKDAGFKVKAAVEINQKAQETYKLNHSDVQVYLEDIRKLDPKSLLKDIGLDFGELDLLAGCPPCQGHSRLRTRNQRVFIDDDRNDLVNEYLRFVKEIYPKTLMMENVPALEKDIRFSEMIKILQQLGYKTVVKILDAANYNVPQRRRRLILLGSRVHEPKIATPSESKLTVRQAFKGLGKPEKSKDKLHAYPENRSQSVRELIALIPKNGGSRLDLGEDYQLECHKRTGGFRDVYGRMAWDDVSPTITSGCSNPSKGRFLHPSDNRTITLREAAVLQGFPKNYKFDVTHGKEAISLMIGNALPPPFIAANAMSLKSALREIT